MSEKKQRKNRKPEQVVMDFIQNRDKFGSEVKWNINGEDKVKTCPGGACSIIFMIIFWLMTITAVLEYAMQSNWTIVT